MCESLGSTLNSTVRFLMSPRDWASQAPALPRGPWSTCQFLWSFVTFLRPTGFPLAIVHLLCSPEPATTPAVSLVWNHLTRVTFIVCVTNREIPPTTPLPVFGEGVGRDPHISVWAVLGVQVFSSSTTQGPRNASMNHVVR